MSTPNTDHCPRPWVLGHAAQLGALEDTLRGPGYRVLTPAYPGFEVEVEALNADPSPVVALTIPRRSSPTSNRSSASSTHRPSLIGHSAGGTFVQLLLNRGLGAVGVALNSAPTEGVRSTPPAQLRALAPIFLDIAKGRRAIPFSRKQWHKAFANAFTEAEASALYDRYHVPASREILLGTVTGNFKPGHQDSWVDYRNDARAPLLFISGSRGATRAARQSSAPTPATTSRSRPSPSAKSSRAVLTSSPAQPGWEEVADYALTWATTQTGGLPAAST